MVLTVNQEVDKLSSIVNEYVTIQEKFVLNIESGIDVEISALRARVELRVAATQPVLTSLVADIYIEAEYHLVCAMWHASPSLLGLISAIWGAAYGIFQAVKIFLGLIHFYEILRAIQILAILFPQLRVYMNSLYRKVSEFSQAIGWGVDGMQHLIQATQGSIALLGGVLGKDKEWLNMRFADKSVKMLGDIQTFASFMASDSAVIMDEILGWADYDTLKEGNTWWSGVAATLKNASEKATSAVSKIDAVLDEFAEAQNALPAFIRNNIPQAIWDGISWANNKIDATVLPAITKINKTIGEVNAQLEAQRAKAAELAERLAHPGDLLAEIDKLPGYARTEQLIKIDGVTSTLLREQNEADYKAMEAGLRQSGLIADALKQMPPPLGFMELELPGRSPGIVAEPWETWFVGDY